MEYSADVKKIFNDIKKLIYDIRNCKSKSRYEYLLDKLYNLYDLCDLLNISNYPLLDEYSYKNFNIDYYKYANGINDYVQKNKDYYLEFMNNLDNINSVYYDNEYIYALKELIVNDENMKILEDYLKNYEKNIYQIYKKMLKDSKIIISSEEVIKNLDGIYDSDEVGVNAVAINYSDNEFPYVLVPDYKSIANSIFLIHELGHCYDMSISKYSSNKNKYKNHLDEVYSHYISFKYINYLIENRIYEKDAEVVNNGLNCELICELKFLKKFLTTDDSFDFKDVMSSLEYSAGITLAYHFFDRYLINKKKAEEEIEYLIMNKKSLPFLDILNNLNLKDELINSKILIKYLNKD